MNLIVDGADYSACGLGQIVTISDEVRAIFANYTNQSSARMAALQTFLNAIGGTSGSIYGKLQILQLPCLGGSVVEAFYDLKKGSARYTSGITAANVATYFNLLRGGLIATTNITALSQLQFTGLTSFENQNRFVAFGLDSTTTTVNRFLSDLSGGTFRNNNYNFSTYGGGSGTWGTGYAKNIVLNLTYGTSSYIHYFLKSDIGDLNVQGTGTNSTTATTAYLGLGNGITQDWHMNLDNPVLVQVLGAGLTDAEATTFYTALSTFTETMAGLL